MRTMGSGLGASGRGSRQDEPRYPLSNKGWIVRRPPLARTWLLDTSYYRTFLPVGASADKRKHALYKTADYKLAVAVNELGQIASCILTFRKTIELFVVRAVAWFKGLWGGNTVSLDKKL